MSRRRGATADFVHATPVARKRWPHARTRIFGVCANCGQYVRGAEPETADCFNECRNRGFALEPVLVDFHMEELSS